MIFVPFDHGTPADEPKNLLKGFVDEKGDAIGRPVGVAIDKHGAFARGR
jgi:glucose/arabinose dehydrogenase